MASTITVDKIKGGTSGVAFTLPTADGSAGQLLKTNGSAVLGWATDVDTGITSVAADTTPQLGGDLDVNGQDIVSTANADIDITPNGTGSVVLDGLKYPQADGTANYVLKTNGSAQLSWVAQTDTTYTVGDGGLTTNDFTNADHTKLNAIEASADVTDTLNVTSAGALMDSELAGIAAVKATTGTFLTADQTKLDGIATSANNYSHPSSAGDKHIPSGGSTGDFLKYSASGTAVWSVDNNTVYTHPNHSGEVTSTADGATVIAGNVVDEANLKVSNAPTNGQFLSAQSANSGGMTWATVDTDATMGGDISGTASNAQLVANCVTATEIAADAVGSSEIAANAVDTSELATGSVTSAKCSTGINGFGTRTVSTSSASGGSDGDVWYKY